MGFQGNFCKCDEFGGWMREVEQVIVLSCYHRHACALGCCQYVCSTCRKHFFEARDDGP